jgi:hypothetical protein
VPAHRIQHADARPAVTDGAQAQSPGQRPALAVKTNRVGHVGRGRGNVLCERLCIWYASLTDNQDVE